MLTPIFFTKTPLFLSWSCAGKEEEIARLHLRSNSGPPKKLTACKISTSTQPTQKQLRAHTLRDKLELFLCKSDAT